MATEAKESFAGENFMRDILAKDPQTVTELERDVLRARRSYLTRSEVERFGLDEVEEPKLAPAVNVAADAEDEPAGKAGKPAGKAGKPAGKAGKSK